VTVDPVASSRKAPRSFLFVPADRAARLLPTAVRSGADAIIVDLEDGVAPSSRPTARAALGAALAGAAGTTPVFVRVNPTDGPDFGVDLAALDGLSIAGIVIPKFEAPDLERLTGALAGRRDRYPGIIAILETPRGVLEAASIAAHPSIFGIALGAEDLALRTGMRRSAGGEEILVARSLIVLAAAAAGCWAIDTPSLELEDMEAVRRDARTAAELGFDGKLLVHPRQVSPVHEGFAPSEEEVTRARRIVAVAAELEATGRGVAGEAGRMIDRPVIEAARLVVARVDEQRKERG
jgi:citrate lyase subunit beta/citryl-CoA lyase